VELRLVGPEAVGTEAHEVLGSRFNESPLAEGRADDLDEIWGQGRSAACGHVGPERLEIESEEDPDRFVERRGIRLKDEAAGGQGTLGSEQQRMALDRVADRDLSPRRREGGDQGHNDRDRGGEGSKTRRTTHPVHSSSGPIGTQIDEVGRPMAGFIGRARRLRLGILL